MSDNILIYGLNWLGDSIMAMPAVEAARKQWGDAHITMLAGGGLGALWELEPAVNRIEVLHPEKGTLQAGRYLRQGAYSRCYILPNSFRSAWIPFLARIPVRRGARGHFRSALLTETVRAHVGGGIRHQSEEYFDILGLAPQPVAPPRLQIPDALAEKAGEKLGPDARAPWMAVLPGAARGVAKRWEAQRFAEVGRQVQASTGMQIVVLGSTAEQETCAAVAESIGSGALDLAGQTSLPVLAAMLAACRVAVTNDSGGMHLASAVGTPVVAVFGITDPRTTGPLGTAHRVVMADAMKRSRDVPRDSTRARAALDAVAPGQVLAAVHEVLGEKA